MQKYKVTLILTAEEFIEMIQHRLGPSNNLKVEKVVEKTDEPKLDPSAMSAPRGKRKSKVVITIIDTLKGGPRLPSELREALAARGMSESSLSTGLSILQKSGQIKRGDSGNYYLVQEAAE